MKKKILFIISNMESGGVSKSMSSLLNVIDSEKYEVDCFILSPKGIFLDSIPNSVNIISEKSLSYYFSKFPNNLIKLISLGEFKLFFLRLIAGFIMFINKGWGGYILSRGIKKINKNYDLAVDYNGQHQLYYLVDKIKAKKKVTFFHSDYKKWPFYYKVDKRYFPKVDKIYTISDTCVDSLKELFPNLSHKIGKMENITSIDLIHKMANEKVTDGFDHSYLNLITIGHISRAKGSDLAINAAKLLKQKDIKFKWYFIGAHTNREYFEKLVEINELLENVIFLGLKSNPYPYIKSADIIVHPSTFEGRSIALDEAKILCKPVVVTNFSTVNDQFKDRFNASICNFDPGDISAKIIELYSNNTLGKMYSANLMKFNKSNEGEIEKLYNIIEWQYPKNCVNIK